MLPSMTMQWKEWKDQNIPTQVLALDQQLGARFPYQFLSASEREPPPVWQLPFPLSKDRINEAITFNTPTGMPPLYFCGRSEPIDVFLVFSKGAYPPILQNMNGTAVHVGEENLSFVDIHIIEKLGSFYRPGLG